MQLLGRDQRKAGGEIEAHLVTEDRETCPRTGPVNPFSRPSIENGPQEARGIAA